MGSLMGSWASWKGGGAPCIWSISSPDLYAQALLYMYKFTTAFNISSQAYIYIYTLYAEKEFMLFQRSLSLCSIEPQKIVYTLRLD